MSITPYNKLCNPSPYDDQITKRILIREGLTTSSNVWHRENMAISIHKKVTKMAHVGNSGDPSVILVLLAF